MPIRLHNTLSRAVEDLSPVNADGIYRMYCCGPTVYGPSHIGNFRTFIIQDVLRRALEIDLAPGRVQHVRNITDVDDRIIVQTQTENNTLAAITSKWTALFHADCAALKLLPPHHEPGAVEHLPSQIALIERLITHGHAYKTDEGSVYFDVSSYPAYGGLARLDFSALRQQSTNSGGTANLADKYDRDAAADFALWKARKPEDGSNFWSSPWGDGRPGWHIECSAMIEKIFAGQTIDLHGGGVDLIFPHHENEIAQSCCAHEGESAYRFVRHWFHSAHLMLEDTKMSRSLGNLFTLGDIQKQGYAPVVLRYVLLTGHYRSPLVFTRNGLDAAQSALQKLDKNLHALAARAADQPARAADLIAQAKAAPPASLRWGRYLPAWQLLADDLNIPGALGEIFKVEPKVATLEQAREDLEGLVKIAVHTLGLDLPLPVVQVAAPANVATLAQQRWEAKQARDFARADKLRGEITALGWKVLDRKDGFDLAPE